MSGARTDIEAVEAANAALYQAVEDGDLETLSALWLQDGVTVIHPGWPVLSGRAEVLRSYALIMANTEYIQFFLTDVEVSVHGDTAVVSCTENILSGGPAEEDGSAGPLVGGLVVATNIFRRTEADDPGDPDPADGWRLWSHHGSPVLVEHEGETGGSTPAAPAPGIPHPPTTTGPEAAPPTADEPPPPEETDGPDSRTD